MVNNGLQNCTTFVNRRNFGGLQVTTRMIDARTRQMRGMLENLGDDQWVSILTLRKPELEEVVFRRGSRDVQAGVILLDGTAV